MKTINYILFFFATLTLLNCQKHEEFISQTKDQVTTITVAHPSKATTKVSFSDVTDINGTTIKVAWEIKDTITIYSVDGNRRVGDFYCSAVGATATFEKSIDADALNAGDKYIAVYPASRAENIIEYNSEMNHELQSQTQEGNTLNHLNKKCYMKSREFTSISPVDFDHIATAVKVTFDWEFSTAPKQLQFANGSYFYNLNIKDISKVDGKYQVYLIVNPISEVNRQLVLVFNDGVNEKRFTRITSKEYIEGACYNIDINSSGDVTYDTLSNLADFTVAGTANCYILSHGNTYYIPVEGRINTFWRDYAGSKAITDGAIKLDDTWEVDILWHDAIVSDFAGFSVERVTSGYQGAILPLNDGKTEDFTTLRNGGPCNSAMKVVIPSTLREANVVVVVWKDSNADNKRHADETLWSWHLWVHDGIPDEINGIMEKNLGSGDSPAYAPMYSEGLIYYQFGRKDPFPGNKAVFFQNTTDSDGDGDYIDDMAIVGPVDIATSVNNPEIFYTINSGGDVVAPADWCSEFIYDGRWYDKKATNSQIKSFFDPSPLGWKVPSKIWITQEDVDAVIPSIGQSLLNGYGQSIKGVNYTQDGYRGGGDAALQHGRRYAYYWTASLGKSFNFRPYSTFNLSQRINRSQGCSVRPIRDTGEVEGASLTINKTEQSVAQDKSRVEVKVTSNTVWTVSSNATWAEVGASLGYGDGAIYVNYDENNGTTSRSAIITFKVSGVERTFVINQAATTGSISIDYSRKNINSAAGEFILNIKSNGDWSVNDVPNWLTFDKTMGDGDCEINVSYEANNLSTYRSATVTFKVAEVTSQVMIVQNEMGVISYEVADFYPNTDNPIGVVYMVSEDGKSGKVVSLATPPKNWNGGDNIAECLPFTTESGALTIELLGNGIANMRRVAELNDWENKFPAFYWAHCLNINGEIDTKGYMDDVNGVWFLPSISDLEDMAESVHLVDAAMGFEGTNSDGFYRRNMLSSSSWHQNNHYIVTYNWNWSAQREEVATFDNAHVRAVMEF